MVVLAVRHDDLPACDFDQTLRQKLPLRHLAFNASNRLAWVQSLWTGFRAIHDRMAAI